MEVPNISLATQSRWRSATISWYTSSPSKDMLSCWSTAAPRTSVPLEWHRLGSSRSMSWALWMKMGGNKHTWNSQKMVKIGVRAKTAQLRRKTAQWRVKTAHSENSKIRKTGKFGKVVQNLEILAEACLSLFTFLQFRTYVALLLVYSNSHIQIWILNWIWQHRAPLFWNFQQLAPTRVVNAVPKGCVIPHVIVGEACKQLDQWCLVINLRLENFNWK